MRKVVTLHFELRERERDIYFKVLVVASPIFISQFRTLNCKWQW